MGAWLWWSGGRGPDPIRIVVAQSDLARGAALYAEHCAACHGAELEGQPDWRSRGSDGVLPAPPHDATGHSWHHADEVLFRYTRLGGARLVAEQGVTGFKSGMPAFGDVLSDAEIRDVIAFIKSRWSDRERSYQREVTLQHEVRR
jgi:mono/diheme cytochrome c family protein